MNAETLKIAKVIECFLKDRITVLSQNESFFGHCERHLMSPTNKLIGQALNPMNKFGVGSCFHIRDYEELKSMLIHNMTTQPIFSELALWLAEGSKNCVFYIPMENCGIAYSKKFHNWEDGPLICNQAIIVAEKTADDYRFRIKTAYPLPDIY